MNWLKDEFVNFYKITRRFEFEVETLSPPETSFKDEKPCSECNSPCEDEVVFKIKHETPIQKLAWDKFFQQFSGMKFCDGKKCCDLLLFEDGRKIVFCEMTCSQQKYIESKSAKARKQLQDSSSVLLNVDKIKERIKAFSKVCIFAVRKNSIGKNNDALKRMNAMIPVFTKNPTSALLGNGFELITVTYPTTYTW